ncbi:short-chain dehydrogenase [Alkalicoccobacillus porphyridii]|uniref:Short-chain dehydrogenase n=1 Tax=Alkalicoccobacillus porphyridii TaxID=2597270 RepID=A0A553ZYU3_9BACI|nr:short-chain dehydrogenase [Alkalicoccobacillus porphyridii]TSB46617.1 short-chain dehydrogenase [Alkalicoccobacillus porphyridii]
MKNVLIFGGTGMLLQATKWLEKEYDNITVFGRDAGKNPWLLDQVENNNFEFLELDYRNTEHLKKLIQQSFEKYGQFDCVLAWIHGTAPNALATIIKELEMNQRQSYRLFHVKGSSSSLSHMKNEVIVPDNCLYREVILGFCLEGDSSRWLTHKEISDGVINAIKDDDKKSIVGTVTPWERRPS